MTTFLLGMLILLISCNSSGPEGELTQTHAGQTVAQKDNSRLDWFKEAKFGMFIHWGIYSQLAGEWNGKTEDASGRKYNEWIMLQAGISSEEYEQEVKKFNPEKLDVKSWVSLAKKTGMKYIVYTAKHHDGFCMYDSKYTDYDIVDATPFKRDPLKELSEECEKQGIRLCIYYSVVDWHYPDFPSKYSQINMDHPGGFHGDPNPEADMSKYASYMYNQVEELMTNYGDVGIMWFDGGSSFLNYPRKDLLEGDKLVARINEINPNTLINNRLGFDADYGTPEQYIPQKAGDEAFEVCMTLNKSWGYVESDNNWKPSEQIVDNLLNIASKGGNFLLNVGPKADGTIPQASIDILMEVGQWLDTYEEAYFGTEALPQKFGVSLYTGHITKKGNKLYVSPKSMQENDQVFIKGIDGTAIRQAYPLDNPQNLLQVKKYERAAIVDVNNVPQKHSYPSPIVLELEEN